MDIQKLINSIPFLKDNVRSFNLSEFTNGTKKQILVLSFEIKEVISEIELDLIHCEFSQQIITCLQLIEDHIWEKGLEPVIRFIGGIKNAEIS